MGKYGILTLFYKNYNLGGILQAYALSIFLNNNDISSIVIKYDYSSEKKSIYKTKFEQLSQYSIKEIMIKTFKRVSNKINDRLIRGYKEKLRLKYDDFINENIVCTDNIVNYEELALNVLKYDGYIVGSDQVWNPNVVTDGFLLKDFPENVKKISYAASISRNQLSKLEEEILTSNINNFDYISVREDNAVELLKKGVQNEITSVLDPTFLLKKDEWISNFKPEKLNKKYALCYIFNNRIEYYKKIADYCNDNNLEMIIIPYADGNYNKYEFKNDKYHYEKTVGPKEFVTLIHNAEIVFTDSFHGVAFSCILGTNFLVLKRDNEASKTSKNCRLNHLLKIFELQDRLISIDEIGLKEKIDFANVDRLINKKREESINFLMRALKEGE